MYAMIPELTKKQKKLFWSKVEIKGPDDCWQTKVAKLFNVTRSTIQSIVENRNWAHIIGVASDLQVAVFLRTGTSVPYVMDFQI
jgi:hypothetical protein